MQRYVKMLPLALLIPVLKEVEKECCCDDRFTGNRTICLGPDFSTGPCPLPYGVCCLGSSPCCPYGNKCSEGGHCRTDEAWQGENMCDFVGMYGTGLEDMTVCPDFSQCPDDFTCYSGLPSGYGCFPFEDATCCTDQSRCCPENTVCSEDSSFCFQLAPTVAKNNSGEMKVAGFLDAIPYAYSSR